MITQTKALSAIIPLDFGTKVEHTVVIFEPDWTQLIPFLTDPQTYIKKASKRWKQDAKLSWDLNTPATAWIKPVTTDLPTMVRWLELGAFLGWEGIPQQPYGTTDAATTLNYTFHELWNNNQDVQKGCFLIEFAIDTSVVTISYLPPKALQLNPPTPAQRHYQGTFSNATVSECSTATPLTMSSAVVHLDLAKSAKGKAASDRAEVIVDLMESRQWFIDLLNNRSCFTVDFALTPEKEVLKVAPEPAKAMPKRKFVLPSQLTAQPIRMQPLSEGNPSPIGQAVVNFPGQADPPTIPTSTFQDLPTIIVDNLQAAPTACTCIPSELAICGPNYLLLGHLVKSYACVPIAEPEEKKRKYTS